MFLFSEYTCGGGGGPPAPFASCPLLSVFPFILPEVNSEKETQERLITRTLDIQKTLENNIFDSNSVQSAEKAAFS